MKGDKHKWMRQAAEQQYHNIKERLIIRCFLNKLSIGNLQIFIL